MKEVTRVITLNVTSIQLVNDEEELAYKGDVKDHVEQAMRALGADHCEVTDVQDFVRDLEEDNE